MKTKKRRRRKMRLLGEQLNTTDTQKNVEEQQTEIERYIDVYLEKDRQNGKIKKKNYTSRDLFASISIMRRR